MFFRRRKQEEEKKKKPIRGILTGLIIGGAIASIVGKKLLDKREKAREELDEMIEEEEGDVLD
ncbi:hypothetical protein COW95_01495 [Candidatus Peregrinibacteria bacterium CG22_combo_CG10-13_8_21_14_all_49_11]|nr:MAG: hypothetical protein COW95_01495 [Candidatus Peregrinibacteria bacterium CG22_combo_CG10-13_8_21_14_all_49_11]